MSHDEQRVWRSLEELAETAEFGAMIRREFPDEAAAWLDPESRRGFLRLMGASLALAGVGGCAIRPHEDIVPYTKPPEAVVPGKPLFFATALTLGGYATGVLVESHMGRPTKIEGNPDHPASLGATDAFAQAEILGLYDPDRSQVATFNGRVTTWDNAVAALIGVREAKLRTRGRGLRLLTGTITSPTLAAQIRGLLRDLPEARWHQYEPVHNDAAREGARRAFGEAVAPIYRLDRADVIVALDSDFLTRGPGHLVYARQFAARREPKPDGSGMNRLYAIEPTPSLTGAIADHRFAVAAREVGAIAQALARGVGVAGVAAGAAGPDWVARIAADLKAHAGSSLVVAGDEQPATVHALAHAMNQALGNAGKTVHYVAGVEAEATAHLASIRDLTRDIRDGAVDALVILGGNPAYDAPADLDFAGALEEVETSVRLGLYEDETSARCRWHVPQAHELESWGDARAFDGTVTFQQPLIAPLYGGRTAYEVVAALAGKTAASVQDLVRDHWKREHEGGDFDAFWKASLHAGVVEGTAAGRREVTLRPDAAGGAVEAGGEGLEIVFRPDPTVWDGRYANNGWLQELHKPITKLTWDNAALVAPELARRRGLNNGDVVSLTAGGRTVRAAVWITPGQAANSVTLHLGYGRTRAGRVGSRTGFNAYALRTTDRPWAIGGLSLERTGDRYELATTQHHHSMEGRAIIRSATLAEYRRNPEFAQTHEQKAPRELTLYEDPEPRQRREAGEVGNAWGMAINLNTCLGCGACVVACQAENNIPIVGKSEVLRGREMHWLRIDRYFEGSTADDPKILHQPVLCMHCEKAPCELVCPVEATSHSAEGLNEMTYNRCVGTRYCSNNCPYKVRRFNFLRYADHETPSLKLGRNPDVTVRWRGVMEKCTYCVQRINGARIRAEIEDRIVGGNEVVTACQQACPTRAIVFGNLNDRAADVVEQKKSPRNYGLLAELNTRPRTTYLARLSNPAEGA